MEASKNGGVGKFSDFLALSVNIWKTVPKLLLMTYNEVVRGLSIDTKIDDLE